MGGPGSGRKPTVKNEARDAKNASQKVVHLFAHPRLETVPDPEFPLQQKGQEKYRELAEMLLKAGQLTIITKGYAETAAVAFQTIHKLSEDGKEIRAALIQQYNRALGNIQQFDIDRQVAGTPAAENKFRHSGFASRRR